MTKDINERTYALLRSLLKKKRKPLQVQNVEEGCFLYIRVSISHRKCLKLTENLD